MATLVGLLAPVKERAELAMQVMQLMTGGRELKGKVSGGIVPTITSGYRSIAKQKELYDARATNPYPVNRPGDSAHNFGLAFDSDVPDRYMPLWIAVRRAVGFTVPANDEVHAEVPSWREYI